MTLPATARTDLLGGLLWGAAMAVGVSAGLWRATGFIDAHIGKVVFVYFVGGAVAFPLAIRLARCAAGKARGDTRFAAAFFALVSCTIGVTALVYAGSYAINMHGVFHFIVNPSELIFAAFTAAAGLAQFAVLGMRLYLPLGLVMLLFASLWLTRHIR